jgi:hypothetical protein
MSRKHFVRIAAVVAEISSEAERRELALTLCASFQLINPRFNRARFLAACKL